MADVPEKVALDRIRAAGGEGRPIYKARRLDVSTVDWNREAGALAQGELFLSSKARGQKYIADKEVQVIVVEGLLLFEKTFNAYLESLYDKHQDAHDDIDLLLEVAAAGSVELLQRAYNLQDLLEQKKINGNDMSAEDRNLLSRVLQSAHKDRLTISGLAFGILLAGEAGPHDMTTRLDFIRNQVFDAAKGNGITMFKAVLENLESEGNSCIGRLCTDFRLALSAFAQLFEERIARNVYSHPFKFIGADKRSSQLAMDALVLFKENQARFPELAVLMEASVPYLEAYVRAGVLKENQEAERKNRRRELSFAHLGIC